MNISGTTPSLIMWFNGGKTPIKQLEINNVTFTSEKTFSDHKLYKYNKIFTLHFYWTCCSILNVCLNKSIIRLWSDEMCWSNADLQAGGAASILVPQTISAASALDRIFRERIQLPQLQHGLHHELQRPHATGPASARMRRLQTHHIQIMTACRHITHSLSYCCSLGQTNGAIGKPRLP